MRELFKLQMQIKVVEIEFDAVARALAERLSGDVSEQVQPHDLWDWVSDTVSPKQSVDQGLRACGPGGVWVQLQRHERGAPKG